ncbi:serine protease family [Plasmopara halstedii]|uniref:Serine protease family n=1 Tax=Plasmopara halstedii TaxID=4781 RepID=A0A0P1ACV7_PLAHL|nr:serine protease family [Plasmopara halstedii]CEG38767.1 serine protease family [Plasmopara halstedii]|eukprot:XP_024575136.1 serine protease family [Plasmopara halstedii]
MKTLLIGAFTATVASLSAASYGYSFSDTSMVETKERSTDITKNAENHIYGGTAADVRDYPSLASLRDSIFQQTFCAGALIHPQFILTAGHCIRHTEFDIVATFGTNDSAGDSSGHAITVPVATGFRHPMYRKKQHLYDVGLLKLEKPIRRPLAKLCARDGSDNEIGTEGTVVGWGKTEDSKDMGSPILEKLVLPIISNAECGKFEKYIGRITEGMLCAGVGNGLDTCNGDSGGPFFVKKNILVGCVSWGSTCGQQPGVFTRLTYVMDYIEDILNGGDGSKFYVESSFSDSASGSMSEAARSSDLTPEDEDDPQSSNTSDDAKKNILGSKDALKSVQDTDSNDQHSGSDATFDATSGSDKTVHKKNDLEHFMEILNQSPEDSEDIDSKVAAIMEDVPPMSSSDSSGLFIPPEVLKAFGVIGQTRYSDDLVSNTDDAEQMELFDVKSGNNIENDEPVKAKKTSQEMTHEAVVPRDSTTNTDYSVQQMDTAEQVSDL